MDGQCLEAKGTVVDVGTCVAGAASQKFKFVKASNFGDSSHGSSDVGSSFSVQQGGLCVDNNQTPGPTPAPPPPGGAADVSIELSTLNLGISGAVRVRDVWEKKDLDNLPSDASTFKISKLPYHGSAFVIFMPEDSKWPLPFELAPWMKTPLQPTPP
jgi:hypothetical protein